MMKDLKSFTIALLAGFVFFSVALLIPGAVRVTGHEGDLLHSYDLIYRLAAGDRAHIDFMTPLGVLSFAPPAFFVALGFGPGKAMLFGQITVCLVLLPSIWWVAASRLTGLARLGFGIGVIALIMAMVFGGGNPALNLSMYYNRWAWALAGLIIILLMLPPRPRWDYWLPDIVILGGAGACLVLLKVTYVLALAPFAIAALITVRDWRRLGGAVIVMLGILAVATLVLGGPQFWPAYIGDLVQVATSSYRSHPGEQFTSLLGKPNYVVGTMAMLGAIVFWRKTGRLREGLLLLLLAPGLVYITYQNWGNDPIWLALLAVIVVSVPVKDGTQAFFGVPAREVNLGLGLIALTLIAPSLINLASSPMRHAAQKSASFRPIFIDPARHDAQMKTTSFATPKQLRDMPGFEDWVEESKTAAANEPLTVNGEVLDDCRLQQGMMIALRKTVGQLSEIPETEGKTVLIADVFDYLWMFGPYERNRKMAPWFYGADSPGFQEADYIVVPYCPLSTGSRRGKLEIMKERFTALDEVTRTDLFILLKTRN